MYSYNSIEKLLSQQARTILSANNNELFNQFEPQAEQIVLNKANVDKNNPPAWVKQPFVWILEYLIQNQFTGKSPEYIDMISERYKEAIKILQEENNDIVIKSSKVGYYKNIYSGEF